MSGADEAEASRLRVGPYLSSPGAESLDPTAANAKTQLIPMVDADPAGAGDRVADGSDAVPLIGQPEASDAKHSVARHAAATIPSFPPAPDPPKVHRPPAVAIPLPRRNVDDSAVDTVTDGVPVPIREDLPAPNDLPVPEDVPRVAVPGDLDVWAGPSTEPNGGTEMLEPAAELVRPGPPMLEEDFWDVAPDRDRGNDLYQGKRRSTIPWARILLIVVLVAAVGGLFAIPIALNNSSIPGAAGTSDDPTVRSDDSDVPGDTKQAGELVSAASSPGTRSSGPAAAGVSGSPGATAPTLSRTVTTTAPVVQPPAPLVTIALQAESATLSAFWQTDDQLTCGAGTAVVRTGKWINGPPGVLTFNVSVATAGSYTMRIYYVITGNETRTAEISVNDASVATGSFGYMCSPLTPRDVVISLKQGGNQIRFTNHNSRGPSIDRIEIRQP